MLAIHTILHPTDFSDGSGYAFRLACAIAQTQGAKIHLLHVARHPVIVPVETTVPPVQERYHEQLTAELAAMRASVPHLQVVQQLLFVGDAAAEIVRVAQAINADMIIMGTHGRTGLGKLLMGSVAEKVVRTAPCAVVTARAPLAGKKQSEPTREAVVEVSAIS